MTKVLWILPSLAWVGRFELETMPLNERNIVVLLRILMYLILMLNRLSYE